MSLARFVPSRIFFLAVLLLSFASGETIKAVEAEEEKEEECRLDDFKRLAGRQLLVYKALPRIDDDDDDGLEKQEMLVLETVNDLQDNRFQATSLNFFRFFPPADVCWQKYWCVSVDVNRRRRWNVPVADAESYERCASRPCLARTVNNTLHSNVDALRLHNGTIYALRGGVVHNLATGATLRTRSTTKKIVDFQAAEDDHGEALLLTLADDGRIRLGGVCIGTVNNATLELPFLLLPKRVQATRVECLGGGGAGLPVAAGGLVALSLMGAIFVAASSSRRRLNRRRTGHPHNNLDDGEQEELVYRSTTTTAATTT